ncbi:hypothetical protein KAK07_18220 [Ideonella sp. 4Y16]|uniref:CARDB domain-containing protein n=1 Tax=Ideonella alba TaxID=2824118 RepID=A0A940YDL9_9BURK|nr:hypothetical protein [Ideonella alba]MBQ0930470.1 hypothetical protein [Ideonella alba]MBQ0945280.1 hypothetical protein [Ideonella alba]
MRFLKVIAILGSVFFLGNTAVAQNYTFTEKWPANIKIVPTNAVSEYLKANFGRIGEVAAGSLDNCLADPKCRAKMSRFGADQMYRIFTSTNKSNDQKASELLSLIENDLGGYSSTKTATLGLVASYAPSYSVARLTWERRTQRLACQKTTCTCPPYGTKVLPGTMCSWTEIIGGVRYDRNAPASCTISTDTVDNEAGYRIYRGDKLLKVFESTSQVVSGTGGIPFSFDFLKLQLKLGIPALSDLPTGVGGPFYDYDPQFVPLGKPLTYRVEAFSDGCGMAYNNSWTGLLAATDTITVDGDGDGRADFFPKTAWDKKLSTLPGGFVPGEGMLSVSGYGGPGYINFQVKNTGSGTISGLAVACTAGPANIVAFPASTLAPGATTSVGVWRSDGAFCKPRFSGTNMTNSPLLITAD